MQYLHAAFAEFKVWYRNYLLNFLRKNDVDGEKVLSI